MVFIDVRKKMKNKRYSALSFFIVIVLILMNSCVTEKPANTGKEKTIPKPEITRTKAVVKKEGGRVWIEGVEPLTWGTSNTFIAALAASARAVGDNISYEELMGYSGAAFRLHFHQPEWCPSSPDAGVGFDCTNAAFKSLGYTIEPVSWDKKKPETLKTMHREVAASIDRGLPVLAIDLIGAPDWGIIAGYADNGDTYLCRTFHKQTGWYNKNEKNPWWVYIIKKRYQKPDRKQLIINSFRAAVKMAKTKKFGKYTSGFAAFEAWADDLENDKLFPEGEEQNKIGSRAHINGWIYLSLIDARKAAVEYLTNAANEFDEPAKADILKAAHCYKQVIKHLTPMDKYALHLGHLMSGRTWTLNMRHAEAGVLRRAALFEETAVSELEKVLKIEAAQACISF
jgi:hypothetical protein